MNIRDVCVNYEKIVYCNTDSINKMILLIEYQENGDLSGALNDEKLILNYK